MMEKCEKANSDIGLFMSRVLLGIIFVAHGILKLQTGVATTAGFFASIGIPASMFFAWVVTIIELIGGVMLILGVGIRLVTSLLIIMMVVSIVKAKWSMGLIIPPVKQGVGAELELAILAGLIPLWFLGGGTCRVSKNFLKKVEGQKDEEIKQ